jgi:hypothetical protein
MGMYVIDDKQRLWRVDRSDPDDSEDLPVERPGEGGGWQKTRLKYHDVVIDPTDGELAGLDSAELARFGLDRDRLLM